MHNDPILDWVCPNCCELFDTWWLLDELCWTTVSLREEKMAEYYDAMERKESMVNKQSTLLKRTNRSEKGLLGPTTITDDHYLLCGGLNKCSCTYGDCFKASKFDDWMDQTELTAVDIYDLMDAEPLPEDEFTELDCVSCSHYMTYNCPGLRMWIDSYVNGLGLPPADVEICEDYAPDWVYFRERQIDTRAAEKYLDYEKYGVNNE